MRSNASANASHACTGSGPAGRDFGPFGCGKSERRRRRKRRRSDRDPGSADGDPEYRLPGRTNAFRIAEVRPQVNGIILKRLFEEGSDVKAGQQLYQIDPATYEADYQSAQANLASTQEQAQLEACWSPTRP